MQWVHKRNYLSSASLVFLYASCQSYFILTTFLTAYCYNLCLMSTFLALSSLVSPYTLLKNLIFVTCNLLSCHFGTVQVSHPYSNILSSWLVLFSSGLLILSLHSPLTQPQFCSQSFHHMILKQCPQVFHCLHFFNLLPFHFYITGTTSSFDCQDFCLSPIDLHLPFIHHFIKHPHVPLYILILLDLPQASNCLQTRTVALLLLPALLLQQTSPLLSSLCVHEQIKQPRGHYTTLSQL